MKPLIVESKREGKWPAEPMNLPREMLWSMSQSQDHEAWQVWPPTDVVSGGSSSFSLPLCNWVKNSGCNDERGTGTELASTSAKLCDDFASMLQRTSDSYSKSCPDYFGYCDKYKSASAHRDRLQNTYLWLIPSKTCRFVDRWPLTRLDADLGTLFPPLRCKSNIDQWSKKAQEILNPCISP